MAFLTQEELHAVGFQSVGTNVRISTRAVIYDAARIRIGDNSRVDDLCVLSGSITIGGNVHIAVLCNVAGGEPGIVLDDFAGLAYGCKVFAQSDDYSGESLTNPTVPAQFKREIRKPVHIGRHVIIGCNSVVFPGVTIGDGTSVGSLGVVHKSLDEWSIYAGNPVRRVGPRSKAMLEMERDYLRGS